MAAWANLGPNQQRLERGLVLKRSVSYPGVVTTG